MYFTEDQSKFPKIKIIIFLQKNKKKKIENW